MLTTTAPRILRQAPRTVAAALLAALAALPLLAAADTAEARAKLKVLYRFNGDDGAAPKGRLVFDRNGVAYGTTEAGGELGNPFCCGTVFQLTPPAKGKKRWKHKVIYRFPRSSENGVAPLNGLLLKGGVLYGTAANRGATTNTPCCGTVFQLTRPRGQAKWRHKTIYTFKNVADGLGPAGDLVADDDGALYGVTYAGGRHNRGTVFKLTPPGKGRAKWTKSTLYHFKGGNDGAIPRSGLAFDKRGALYGVTTQDGTIEETCCGTVFKLTPPRKGEKKWSYERLYRFRGGRDGAHPEGRLLIDDKNGVLYGTTIDDGADNRGLVFKLTPPKPGQTKWKKTVLHHFRQTGLDGNFPTGGLERDGSWNLYGVTQQGGNEAAGTIFKLTKNGNKWNYRVLRSLTHQQAVTPYAGLVRYKGVLYGSTIGDRSFDENGTVFKVEQ